MALSGQLMPYLKPAAFEPVKKGEAKEKNPSLIYGANATYIDKYPKEGSAEEKKPFLDQLVLLINQYKQWGKENKILTIDITTAFSQLNDHLTVCLNDYAGKQSATFFENLKKNLEHIFQFIKDNQTPLEKRKKVYQQLGEKFGVCAPGLYTHVEDTLSTLYSQNSIAQWLADLRINIIKIFADKYNVKNNISTELSIHTLNVFLNYAFDAGWNPNSSALNIIEEKYIKDLIGIKDDDIENITNFNDFFKNEYNPTAIRSCINTNLMFSLRKIFQEFGFDGNKWNSALKRDYGAFVTKIINFLNDLGCPNKLACDFLEFDEDYLNFQLKINDNLIDTLCSKVLRPELYFNPNTLKYDPLIPSDWLNSVEVKPDKEFNYLVWDEIPAEKFLQVLFSICNKLPTAYLTILLNKLKSIPSKNFQSLKNGIDDSDLKIIKNSKRREFISRLVYDIGDPLYEIVDLDILPENDAVEVLSNPESDLNEELLTLLFPKTIPLSSNTIQIKDFESNLLNLAIINKRYVAVNYFLNPTLLQNYTDEMLSISLLTLIEDEAFDLAKKLINLRPSVCTVDTILDENNFTALHICMKQEKPDEELVLMLYKYSDLINPMFGSWDFDKKTPFILAIDKHHWKLLKEIVLHESRDLLEQEIPTHLIYSLTILLDNDQFDTFNLIINKRPDLLEYSDLHQLAHKILISNNPKKLELLKILLPANKMLPKTILPGTKTTLLEEAIKCKSSEAINYFLDNGILNQYTKKELSDSRLALISGSNRELKEYIELLNKNNIDFTPSNKSRNILIHSNSEKKLICLMINLLFNKSTTQNILIQKILTEFPSLIENKDFPVELVAKYAFSLNDRAAGTSVIQILFPKIKALKPVDFYKSLFFRAVIFSYNDDLLKCLISRGLLDNHSEEDAGIALYHLINLRKTKVAKELIRYKPTIINDFKYNIDNENHTLHLCMQSLKPDVELILMLCRNNKSLSSVNKNGESPLLMAAKEGHYYLIKKLCEDKDVHLVQQFTDEELTEIFKILQKNGRTDLLFFFFANKPELIYLPSLDVDPIREILSLNQSLITDNYLKVFFNESITQAKYLFKNASSHNNIRLLKHLITIVKTLDLEPEDITYLLNNSELTKHLSDYPNLLKNFTNKDSGNNFLHECMSHEKPSYELVCMLFKNSQHSVNKYGQTPLLIAIIKGHIELCKALCESKELNIISMHTVPQLLDIIYELNAYPKNQLYFVTLFIAEHPTLTINHIANKFINGPKVILNDLLTLIFSTTNPLTISTSSNYTDSFFHKAILNGHDNVVESFLSNHLISKYPDEDLGHSLLQLIKKKKFALAKQLILEKPTISKDYRKPCQCKYTCVCGNYDSTPLRLCLSETLPDEELVRMLCVNNHSKYSQDFGENDSFMVSVKKGHFSLIKSLFENKEIIETDYLDKNFIKYMSLLQNYEEKQLAYASLFLERGVILTIETIPTLLQVNISLELSNLLLNHLIQHITEPKLAKLLLMLIKSTQFSFAEKLLKLKPSICKKALALDENGNTALHLVLLKKVPNVRLVELLCESNPSLLHTPNKFTKTPFWIVLQKHRSYYQINDLLDCFKKYDTQSSFVYSHDQVKEITTILNYNPEMLNQFADNHPEIKRNIIAKRLFDCALYCEYPIATTRDYLKLVLNKLTKTNINKDTLIVLLESYIILPPKVRKGVSSLFKNSDNINACEINAAKAILQSLLLNKRVELNSFDYSILMDPLGMKLGNNLLSVILKKFIDNVPELGELRQQIESHKIKNFLRIGR